MTDEIFSAPPPVPEEVARRLRKSAPQPRVDNLGILDQLSYPKNVNELEMQIVDWKECRMFFPMEGLPRAYMSIPTGDKEFDRIRWVYQVLRIGIAGKSSAKSQAILCESMWKRMVVLRKQFELLYPDEQPILVWRRHIEYEYCKPRDEVAIARLHLRICIPGIDCIGGEQDSGAPLEMLQPESLS